MILDGGGQARKWRFASTSNLSICRNQGARKEPIVRLNSFRRPLAALSVAVLSAGSVATAQTSDYEVRRFDDGPGWLVFDQHIDFALQILNPDNPQCHEIDEIILLFKTPEQFGDAGLIETPAWNATASYAVRLALIPPTNAASPV